MILVFAIIGSTIFLPHCRTNQKYFNCNYCFNAFQTIHYENQTSPFLLIKSTPVITIYYRHKRLVIKTLAGSFVQCICQGSKNRGKCRLTHARGINIILYEMNVNIFRSFMVTDHPVTMEIILLRHTVFKSNGAKQCIANSVNYGAFCKVNCGIGIYYNTAVNYTTYPWYNEFAFL